MNYLAKNIAYLRKINKVTQAEIQARTGFKPNTQSNWENEVSEPAIDIIIQYSEYFKVQLSDLIASDLSKQGTGKSYELDSKPTFAAEPTTGYHSAEETQLQVIEKMQQVIDAQAITIKALQSALEHAEKRLSSL